MPGSNFSQGSYSLAEGRTQIYVVAQKKRVQCKVLKNKDIKKDFIQKVMRYIIK